MLVHDVVYQGENNKIAFFDKTAVTYGQLQQQVSQYRNYFYQQGVRASNNVGLLARNSAEFVYSYLAICSLGAVVVPINFQMVPREVAYIIQDAKIDILVTKKNIDLEPELMKFTTKPVIKQLVITDFDEQLKDLELRPAPIPNIDENDVCAIIYTSGTTGHPKGAMLSHRNIIANAGAYTQVYPFKQDDHVLCILPMYHCFAWTVAIIRSLIDGVTITIAELNSVREIISLIRNNAITVIYGVPTIYNLFTAMGTTEDFAGVRLLISGGAPLPKEMTQQFLNKTGKLIVEGYGLSEAAPIVSVNPPGNNKIGSVGLPLPDTSVKVVDGSGQAVPTGQVGELTVAGPNVMKGYYNLAQETAEALREGWLHTGDLAYLDSDGYIYIVDRLKDMIITSGENVYPREIEEVLYNFGNISEAAVIGFPDKLRGCIVRAYFVSADGSKISKKAIREFCQANLAPYKVPKEYIQLDTLPKNGTGKIMKRELRQ